MVGDAVDHYLRQWARERRDLDVSPMGLTGRLSRASRLVEDEIRAYMAGEDVEPWEFDVLATLRRTGAPYTLSPKELVASSMVGSPAMTNRVDRLVARGLVTREVDAGNRRRLLITLTPEGLELVDRVVDGHMVNAHRLFSALDATEVNEMRRLLRKLLVSLGDCA